MDQYVGNSSTSWIVSHISADFDRSGLAEDPNVAFPLDRLEELAAAGEIGGVSRWHYTFMGAHPLPQMFEDAGTEVGLPAQPGDTPPIINLE